MERSSISSSSNIYFQHNIQQQIKMNSVGRELPEKPYGLSKLAALTNERRDGPLTSVSA